MKKTLFFATAAAWLISPLFLLPAHAGFLDKDRRVLVVTVTAGYRHECIPMSEEILAQLSRQSGRFTLDFARDDEALRQKTSRPALEQYDGIIFNNTSGNIPVADLDVLLAWIREGHGFMGIHAASDSFKDRPEFVDMLGAAFDHHDAQANVKIINVDPTHPATRHLPETYFVKDEIYLFRDYHRDRVHLLLTLEQEPNQLTPGHYPIAWNKKYGKGRVFYTALGHRQDLWQSIPYQKHLLGGILWMIGLESGRDKPQSTEPNLSFSEILYSYLPLFNGTDLHGWQLRKPDGYNSWSVQNGMLVNTPPNDPNLHGTDLITSRQFLDFTLRYEYLVAPESNSGVYLRGRYEIQILDDFDSQQPRLTGNGALYNFKAPRYFASRPAGEWQSVEATVRGNHVTVLLNGVKIHDHILIEHPTGGQVDNNIGTPGPILLQGNHGAVAFRNIRIRELK